MFDARKLLDAIVGAAAQGLRKSRGVASEAASVGGLALIGALAYAAYRTYQEGQPLLGGRAGQGGATPGAGPSQQDVARTLASLSVPPSSQFHPVSQTEDDALLYLRAMVAAASADGHIDEAERSRLLRGLAQAGIDPAATRWLERELAEPVSVEELADPVNTPEKAAQVYAAARIAIDPDTIQEREFLRQLAQSLDLDPALKRQIDDTAGAVKL